MPLGPVQRPPGTPGRSLPRRSGPPALCCAPSRAGGCGQSGRIAALRPARPCAAAPAIVTVPARWGGCLGLRPSHPPAPRLRAGGPIGCKKLLKILGSRCPKFWAPQCCSSCRNAIEPPLPGWLYPYLDTLVITHGENHARKIPICGLTKPFFDHRRAQKNVDGRA